LITHVVPVERVDEAMDLVMWRSNEAKQVARIQPRHKGEEEHWMESLFTLACQDHLPSGTTLAERLVSVRRYGFDAVELRGSGLLERLEETRVALAETGVPVSTICAGFGGSLVHPEPARRHQALGDCKRLLDLAEEWGAQGLIIAADYRTPPLPDLEPAIESATLLHDLLLGGLKELAEHLRGMHATLLLEPLNRYESRALRHMAPAVALCRETGSANIKVMYDTFHMAIEEADPVAALRDAGDRLGHVHLADSNRQVPGHGHTDFAPLLGTLNDMRYDRTAALECTVLGDPDVILPACVRMLREMATACRTSST